MLFYLIKKKLKNRLWEYIKDYFYDHRVKDAAIVQNINYSYSLTQKKAIVCYMTNSLFINWENTPSERTQPYEILAILRALTDLGYTVDVIGCNDLHALSYVQDKHYDLIFGFGDSFYNLAKQQPWAITFLYMTEHHPDFSFKEEQKRIDYYNFRHKAKIKVTRSGTFYKLQHLDMTYDHVIVMGETAPFQSKYEKVHTIYPTGLQNTSFVFSPKNHTQTRKEFLWLGSPGAAIHKGLDLLLDSFSKRNDIVLHIAGMSKQDKKKLAIPSQPNIKDYGFINIGSTTFLDIVSKCSYIILPSCSEGFATSITTGMLHGLIPVVMKDTGFNRLGELAIILDDFHLDYLNNQLTELANQAPDSLAHRSKLVYDFARKNFINQAFERNIAALLNSILEPNHDKSITPSNTPAFIG